MSRPGDRGRADHRVFVVDPVEHVSPSLPAAARASAHQLRGHAVAFVYLEDWRNFEVFLASVETLLKERLGVARITRVTSSLRRGPLTADDLETIRGSAAALVGLGA